MIRLTKNMICYLFTSFSYKLFDHFFKIDTFQCQSPPNRIIKKLEILETYLEKTPIIYSPYLKNKNEEEIIADGQIGIWQDLHEINYICQLYCQRYQKACSNNRRGTFPCSSFRKFDIESLGLWWSRGIHGKLFRITARKYFQVLLFLKKICYIVKSESGSKRKFFGQIF